MREYVLSIDQGTTSSRAIIFDRAGRVVAVGQKEHAQIMPSAGLVEHDAAEIWQNVQEVIGTALGRADLTGADIAAVGITNQRETTILWDRATGVPVHHAIVWQDTRSQEIIDRIAAEGGGHDRFRETTGLPLASYFSASKIAWLLEHHPELRERAEAGELLFGTPDTWILWNLTGGPEGGVHATDVTNASRTLLMNLRTLDWDPEALTAFGVPAAMLPQIRSSSEVYGVAEASSLLHGVPVAGILGDQQAATFGQAAFDAGESKNTYGTGCFLLMQTGTEPVHSSNGLITTVGYQLGDAPAHYALEGSIAVTGSLVQWLRDQLGVIGSADEVEALANTVPDNGGVYIVPAFSGLFAPYWRPDARGAIVGLTRYSNRGHFARAALEAVAYQTRDVLDAVNADVDVDLAELRVDGGMVANDTLMQFQADVLGVPVVRPRVAETTALGAAYVAGLAVGFWANLDELRANRREGGRWEPRLEPAERDRLLREWRKAVTKSMDWVDEDTRG